MLKLSSQFDLKNKSSKFFSDISNISIEWEENSLGGFYIVSSIFYNSSSDGLRIWVGIFLLFLDFFTFGDIYAYSLLIIWDLYSIYF